jgi:hypothetical protein
MDLLHAAACYVEDLPDTTPGTEPARPWDEWVNASRILRSKNTRIDGKKKPQPMTWMQVAEWILANDPRSNGLKASSLVSELSTRCAPAHEPTTV